MLISLNWINDYVNLKNIPLSEQIDRFNLSTAEIEGVTHKGVDLQGAVFAKINKVMPHPNSEKLTVLEVFDGKENLQIVCGAPNVKEGMVTILAPIGASLPGDFKIKKAKIAGVESFGMCCGETELGIGSDDSGIVEVLEEVELGQDIKTHYDIDDVIIEIDNKSLTNRPDLWGHYGIAREFAAIFGLELKKPKLMQLSEFDKLKKVELTVTDPNCLRYSAITVGNVTAKRSPSQMKIRLNYVGQRDINLLADLTNYIMLDLGQPMHAFDNTIVKGINVMPAKKGQKLLTLEDTEHELLEGATLICDQNKTPVAIAGIKGGKLSGINQETTSLLLESACFDATHIRKTSTLIGLRTDSSLRYEKSLDPALTTLAIGRYLSLLKGIDSGVIVTNALTDVQNFAYPTLTIEIEEDFIKNRSGIENITLHDAARILTSLEFKVKKLSGKLEVTVPSHRATKDISIKEDLLEEIARMYGYDNIVPKASLFEVAPVAIDTTHNLEYKTKLLLSSKYNYNEVHSYIWNFAEFNKEYGIETQTHLSLLDASNSGHSGVRSKMLPTMLKFFAENKNNFEEVKIYEIGRVVDGLNADGLAIEKRHLTMLFAKQTNKKEELYFHLKQNVEDVLQTVFSANNFTITAVNAPNESYFHPLATANVQVGNAKVGQFGLVNPKLNNLLDKRFTIAILELDFDDMVANMLPQSTKYSPISKFQTVALDFNFKITNDFNYEQVDMLIKDFKTNLNVSFSLKDIYTQPDFDGFAYWTFSFVLSHQERTLSAKDIETFSFRLTQHMQKNKIELRK